MLATNLTTPPATNNTVQKQKGSQSAFKPGPWYVLISQDLSPGKCSYGGEAWVQAVRGPGESIVCDVEYIKNTTGNKPQAEKDVPLLRFTVNKSSAWHEAQLRQDSDKRRSKRQQQMTTPPPEKLKSKDVKPLKDIFCLLVNLAS
jgi:hypothetical protein